MRYINPIIISIIIIIIASVSPASRYFTITTVVLFLFVFQDDHKITIEELFDRLDTNAQTVSNTIMIMLCCYQNVYTKKLNWKMLLAIHWKTLVVLYNSGKPQ